MLVTLFRRLRLTVWNHRLAHARRYRSDVERVMRDEIAKAQHDVQHCEVMVARARMASIQARADGRLRTAELAKEIR